MCLIACLAADGIVPPPSSPSLLPTCSHCCPGTLMKLSHPSFRLLKAPADALMAGQSAPCRVSFALSSLCKQPVISHQPADQLLLSLNLVDCSLSDVRLFPFSLFSLFFCRSVTDSLLSLSYWYNTVLVCSVAVVVVVSAKVAWLTIQKDGCSLPCVDSVCKQTCVCVCVKRSVQIYCFLFGIISLFTSACKASSEYSLQLLTSAGAVTS